MDIYKGQGMQGSPTGGPAPYTMGGGAGMVGGLGQTWTGVATSVPTESGSPVRDRLSASESWLSDLNMAIDNLEKRLDTILTPAMPSPPNAADPRAAVQRSQSHLQGRLEILNEGFAHMVGRLNHLHSRVEL